MSLSDDLVSRFAKITKDNNGKHESTVYGTVVSRNDKLYVNIDGSDTITPIVSAAEIKAGERVTVLIKDHTATVLGNISNPSASTESVGKILDDYDVVIAKIGQFELVIADKVDTEYLNAQVAVINDLIAGKASIGELNAVKATIKDLDVSKLEADVANINQALINKAEITDLEAVIADINQLNADFADITILVAEKAAISDLNALKATIADLNVGQLRADVADINKAVINKAEITDLNAANAEINALKTNVANINTLVGGNLTMDNIQSLVLSSSKVTVDNAFIKDAMIDSVNASKVNAGVIDTNKVSIQSADGSMVLQGTLQQFKDASGKVRIQIGKDAKGDFTFVLYGADGKGQLINQNGITASAISDGLIVNSMVSDNANIAGSKLDINSVVTEINNGTTTIKGSKVFLDEKNQTFDVAFNNLSTTVDNIQVGGRNLVLNSDVLNGAFSLAGTYKGTRTVVEDAGAKSKKHLEFKCTTAGSGFHTPIFAKSPDKIGKTYTWSFWAKCSVTKSVDIGHESGGQRYINLTTEWQKFTHTWVFTDAQYNSFIWYADWKVGEILYVRDFKIEEGTKATDWTPAPEDTDSAINKVDEKVNTQSTQLSVAQGQIQTLISNTTITKADGQTVTLKDDYSSFKQTVDGINSKVGSLETTVDNNNKTVTSKVSSLEQSLNGVSSELSSVKTTVSNNKQSTDSQLSSFQQSLNGISSNVSSLQKTVDNNNKTVTSKVATLETSLDGITQRVSSTESTTTTLTTKVDNAQNTANSAVSKADTAQNTANTANGKIDNLKTEYQTTKSKVSSLETNLNGITSRVSATETNVEKIGNASTQNLLYNSDFRIVKNGIPDGWSADNKTTAKITFDPNNTLLDGVPSFNFNISGLTEDTWNAVYSPFIDAKPGEKFVASAYVYTANNWSALDKGGHLELEFYDDSKRIVAINDAIDKSKTGWQRLVSKSTAPAGTTRVRMRVHPVRNGQFNMSKPMLQYGETVTGWDKGFDIQKLTTRLSTAESKITEDAITNTVKKNFYTKTETEGAITSKGYQTASQVKQTTDAIKSEVSSLKTTVNNNKQSVDSQFSTFQQTVNGIKGEVSSVKTTVNDNKTNVDSKMATFQQSLNGFSSELSSVKSSFNGLQIGGRNLVLNSDVLNSAFSLVENYKGTRTVVEDTAAKSKKHLEFKCTTAGSGFHTPIFPKSSDKIGKTYTWSFWAKCSVNKSGMVGHESGGQRTINLTTEWQKFTHTWVFTDAQYNSFTWYMQWKVGEILYVRDFKIEEGNKATDWTPAPEDVSAAINTVDQRASSIKQTVDGIDLEVKKKVNSNSIISAINMSPESIKISASKVSISGFVTFSDLSTSGSTTINGANITTGYISGDRIKGGKITATREINFEGGARMFGNTGESNAGLTISAAGFTLGGGAVNYLNGSWYISDDMGVDGSITSNNNSVRFDKQINVSGNITGTSFTCNGPCSLNGNMSNTGTAWLTNVDISGSTTAKGLSCSSIKTSGNVEVSGHFLANGNIYGMNNIALSRGSLYAPVGSATRDYLRFGSHLLSSDPSYGVILTDSAGDWTKVRCGTVIANGTTLSSDKRLKTDIKYINLDAQTIGENGLEAPNVNITTEDMHAFIETLPIASYRLKSDIKADLDKTYYGFIAQDILYSKVGSELIEYDVIELEPPVIDEEGNITKDGVYDDKGLRYSENKFITFICGALQEEIKQRKALERQLNDLMDTINK